MDDGRVPTLFGLTSAHGGSHVFPTLGVINDNEPRDQVL